MTEDPVNALALRLHALKERTGRSYTALASRSALSRSTVHRYCSGAAVPPDFAAVLRLARVCGAGHDDLLELHRLWVLACAVKAEPPAEPAPAPPPGRRPLRRPGPAVVVIAAVLLSLLAAGLTWPGAGTGAELSAGTPAPILLGPACAAVIAPGEHGDCVRQVQTLLREDGARLRVDGEFTAETRRRVVALQVLAGLPPTGRVDEATKHALISGGVAMRTWSEERVERRIRQVFHAPGAADEAVRVARCRSRLDPHWVDGGWGVFQLPGEVLGRYDGTAQIALDPEWNIQAAHWLWAEHRDFQSFQSFRSFQDSRDGPDCPGVSASASPATTAPGGPRSPRGPR